MMFVILPADIIFIYSFNKNVAMRKKWKIFVCMFSVILYCELF